MRESSTSCSPPVTPRVNVLGVGISVLNLPLATDLVMRAIREQRRGYITITGVHGVIESQDDPAFRRILNASFLTTPDGMPMVWMGRLAGHRAMDRVYGPDLMLEIMARSPHEDVRHFLYGGANGVAMDLKSKLTARFPGLKIVGTYEPPFRPLNPEERSALIEQVRSSRPDILWVGLSTPKQEKFMAEYLPQLDVTLMVGVGAAFDFHAGRVKQAPRWMQRSGLEWFFRLWQEPRRLWRRYSRNNPRFVWLALSQKLGLRRFPLDEPLSRKNAVGNHESPGKP